MRNVIGIGAVLLAAAWPCCAAPQQTSAPQSAPAQSVVAAARKAQAEKKNEPKPSKVYTNENIASVGGNINIVGPLPPPPAALPSKTEEAAKPAAAVAAKDEKGEAYWRKRFTEQHQKIALAEKELDIMQRELNLLNVQYYSDPNKAMQEQFNRKEINEKQKNIETKKNEVAQLHQGLDDLESELKRAGGDPGWARQP